MLTERAPAAPPHGLAAIVATFGDPRPLIGRDASIAPTWEVQHITRVKLPRPLRYAHTEVTRIAVHKTLARHVRELFEDIEGLCLWDEIAELAAAYEVRPMHGGGGLSTHAWGIAIDLVPRHKTPPRLVAAFARYGFSWGGPCDSGHFQWATGYGLGDHAAPVSTVAWVPELRPWVSDDTAPEFDAPPRIDTAGLCIRCAAPSASEFCFDCRQIAVAMAERAVDAILAAGVRPPRQRRAETVCEAQLRFPWRDAA